MIKKYLFITIALLLCLINPVTHANEVVINEDMNAALKKFNPRFMAWKTHDYSSTVQQDAAEEKRSPYAIEFDVNGDGKNDLVLDGHDTKNNILLCLLSRPKGYNVIVIRKIDFTDPQTTNHWNDGKTEMGLHYYLWPNKNGTGFTFAYPQQDGPDGNPLYDGEMINYIFKDGKFHESHQIL